MSEKELAAWEKEHMEMLEQCARENFLVKHYVSIAELQAKV